MSVENSSDLDQNRIKLMLVGQENVGKTSLLIALKAFFQHGFKKKKNTLANRRATVVAETKKKELESKGGQLTGDTLSTDGIDIETLQYNSQFVAASDAKEKDKKDDKKAVTPVRNITFSCWDFGGQEVYYTTHAFFLSERSVFLLVWNLLEDEKNSRVSYWLNTVRTHAPNAPVILVGTHLDERKEDKQVIADEVAKIEKKYRKQHKNIQGAFAVSTQSGKGMEDLIRRLEDVAASVLVSYPKPTQTYVALEKSLNESKRILAALNKPPIISWAEFVQLAVKANIIRANVDASQVASQTTRLDKAAEYFHMLGSIFDFNPDGANSTSTRRIVILDVQWIAKVFSTVCSTKNGYGRTGTISEADLFSQIWRDYPGEVHGILLSLFESFEIIYRTPGQTQTLLIPSMLPENTPGDVKQLFHGVSPSSQYLRHYELEFIPNGLFSRFMVRLMRYGNIQRVWRRGILIASNTVDAMALVEMKPSANVISVQMRGADESAELFVQVCEILEFLMHHMFHITAKVKYVDPTNPVMTFTREQLEEWSTRGQWMIPAGRNIIPLSHVAPDLALTNADAMQIDVEKDVVVGEQLGEGAFATVFMGTIGEEKVAVKRLNMKGKDDIQAKKIFGEFRREVLTMSALHHPCVVNLKAFSLQMPYSIIMEYIPHGSLYGFLKDRRESPLPWSTRLRIAYDIAAGMDHLHTIDPPLIHKDLKTPNVLMADLDESAPAMAKVADFGISGKLYMNMFSAKKARDREVENPTWLAPEIIREEPYSAASDVYSFGIMLWEILTQQHPFEEFGFSFNSDLEDAIKKGTRPTMPGDCPLAYRNLIEACWHDDPTKRPTFQEIVNEMLPAIISELSPTLSKTLEGVREVHAAMDEERRAAREALRKQREEKRRAQLEEEKRRKEEEAFRAMSQEKDFAAALGNALGSGLGDSLDDRLELTFAPKGPMSGVAAAAAGAAKTGGWRHTLHVGASDRASLSATTFQAPNGPSAVAAAAAAGSGPNSTNSSPSQRSTSSGKARPSSSVHVSLEMLESSPYNKLNPLDLVTLITNRGLTAPSDKEDKDNLVLMLVRDDANMKGSRTRRTSDADGESESSPFPPPKSVTPPPNSAPSKLPMQLPAIPPLKGENGSPSTAKRPTRQAAASVAAYGTIRMPSDKKLDASSALASLNLAPSPKMPSVTAPASAAGAGLSPAVSPSTSPTPSPSLSPAVAEQPSVSPRPSPGGAKLAMLGGQAPVAGSLKIAAPGGPAKLGMLGAAPQFAPLAPLGAPGAAGRARPQSMAVPGAHASSAPAAAGKAPPPVPPKSAAPATPPAAAPAASVLAPILPEGTAVSGSPISADGEWSLAAGTAGGSPMTNTWRRCPQFQLNITKGGPSKVKINLSQSDAATLPYIGFYVFIGSADGRKKIDLQNAIVYQPQHFMNKKDVEAILDLKEGIYMIMPSIYHPNIEGKFKLTIQGDRARLSVAENWPGSSEASGEWTAEKSGGCMNNPNWKQNPYFKLKIGGNGKVMLTLTPDRRDVGMGFYVFNSTNAAEPVAKSMFTMVTVLRELTLPPGDYQVLPTTFQANITCSFVLGAYGDVPVTLSPM